MSFAAWSSASREDYAEGEYRKVRKALFAPWYDFDDRVVERYEERLLREAD